MSRLKRILACIIDFDAVIRLKRALRRPFASLSRADYSKRTAIRVGKHCLGILAVISHILMIVSRFASGMAVGALLINWINDEPWFDTGTCLLFIGGAIVLHLMVYFFRPLTYGREFYWRVFE